MAYRFNPPPNWPIDDPPWTPPPGWQPDPSWGPAPEGWTYWVEDEAAAQPGSGEAETGTRTASTAGNLRGGPSPQDAGPVAEGVPARSGVASGPTPRGAHAARDPQTRDDVAADQVVPDEAMEDEVMPDEPDEASPQAGPPPTAEYAGPDLAADLATSAPYESATPTAAEKGVAAPATAPSPAAASPAAQDGAAVPHEAAVPNEFAQAMAGPSGDAAPSAPQAGWAAPGGQGSPAAPGSPDAPAGLRTPDDQGASAAGGLATGADTTGPSSRGGPDGTGGPRRGVLARFWWLGCILLVIVLALIAAIGAGVWMMSRAGSEEAVATTVQRPGADASATSDTSGTSQTAQTSETDSELPTLGEDAVEQAVVGPDGTGTLAVSMEWAAVEDLPSIYGGTVEDSETQDEGGYLAVTAQIAVTEGSMQLATYTFSVQTPEGGLIFPAPATFALADSGLGLGTESTVTAGEEYTITVLFDCRPSGDLDLEFTTFSDIYSWDVPS